MADTDKQGMSGIWEKLPPEEFKKLQEYTKYSQRRLKDVVSEFRTDPKLLEYDIEQPMGYDGFKLFMASYLGNYISDELIQTLFWTFHKKIPKPDMKSPELPNALLKKFQSENGRCSMESLDDSTLSRIAKGTRRATVVATATVVAAINPSKEFTGSLLALDGKKEHNSPTRSDQRSAVVVNHAADQIPEEVSINTDNVSKTISFDENLGLDTKLNLGSDGLRYLPMIEIKEVACYLSLLEGGDVQDKLEFVFRVHDSDGSNYLDQEELQSIVAQMIHVAEYLGWDTSALKPILSDMLAEMDCDADGTISMDEWIKGGMDNIPFLVLLGLNVKVGEEGKHQWQMKQFKVQSYCNICQIPLEGFGRKQGLQCTFCRYTCHERCVNRVPASCILTYTKNRSRRKITTMDHHWVEGNCPGKCSRCSKKIKNNCLTGLHCVWCQGQVHNRCVQNMPKECTLGEHRVHILSPICIMPQTRKPKENQPIRKKNSVISYDGIPMLITPLPKTRPLIIFVNPKSGGRQGPRLLSKFLYLLNPRQVFNLAENGPLSGLKFFSQIPDFRILCCGGDGTAGWILSTIDKLTHLQKRPPMAILPLGTGNDLSRCLGWGGGYDGGSLDKHLTRIAHSSVSMMDRWQIDCDTTDKSEEGETIPQSIMNNYFSIGVDASVALKFHLQREKNPEKFNSRFKNKLRYFEAGTSEQLAASCKNMHLDIELICDGKKLEVPSLEGIAILNIPSIYGGAHIWGEPEKKKRGSHKDLNDLSTAVQDMGDKKLEVVGLENSLYVGQMIAGVRQHGLRLAQCSTIIIKVRRTLPMQVDGEPWMQPPAEIKITHKNQTPMCVAPANTRGGFFRFWNHNKCSEEAN